MKRSKLRTLIRSEIVASTQPDDPSGHAKRCIKEVFEEPEADWSWWLWYFTQKRDKQTKPFEEWRGEQR